MPLGCVCPGKPQEGSLRVPGPGCLSGSCPLSPLLTGAQPPTPRHSAQPRSRKLIAPWPVTAVRHRGGGTSASSRPPPLGAAEPTQPPFTTWETLAPPPPAQPGANTAPFGGVPCPHPKSRSSHAGALAAGGDEVAASLRAKDLARLAQGRMRSHNNPPFIPP